MSKKVSSKNIKKKIPYDGPEYDEDGELILKNSTYRIFRKIYHNMFNRSDPPIYKTPPNKKHNIGGEKMERFSELDVKTAKYELIDTGVLTIITVILVFFAFFIGFIGGIILSVVGKEGSMISFTIFIFLYVIFFSSASLLYQIKIHFCR